MLTKFTEYICENKISPTVHALDEVMLFNYSWIKDFYVLNFYTISKSVRKSRFPEDSLCHIVYVFLHNYNSGSSRIIIMW